MKDRAPTGRRTLLQHGLALLGGGVAIAAGARWSRGTPAHAASPRKTPLTFYTRIRPLVGSPLAPSTADRVVATGDLLDAPAGRRVGEFSTNCFCQGSQHGPQTSARSTIEMQVLQLAGGTIFGMSAPANADRATKTHAIIGGTGTFAGARGSYVQRPAASTSGPRDMVEFIVSIAD